MNNLVRGDAHSLMCRTPIEQKLKQEKEMLVKRLEKVDKALTLLENNRELADLFNAVSEI